MIKLFPCKPTSNTLVVYGSVVPHDFPPYHRLNFVRELSKNYKVIFIDLPASSRVSVFQKGVLFYIFLLRTLYKFDYSFVWEFFRFRKLHFLALFLYLSIQKLFFDKRVVLLTTSARWDPVYRFIPFDLSILDCPDRHAGEFEQNKKCIGQFDLVLANTKLLLETLNKLNENTKKVSSGYLDSVVPRFSASKIPNSVIFLGGISQRIDYGFLEKVVLAFPKAEFYFFGEVYLNKYYFEIQDAARLKKWRRILKRSNVHYLGELPENVLRELLPLFGVGIIPYDARDTFNYYSNPIKLYYYLAFGMGVVSTPLPNVEALSKDYPVYLASSWGEFVRKIKLAMSDSRGPEVKNIAKLRAFVKGQSVQRKTLEVEREMSKLFKRSEVGPRQ